MEYNMELILTIHKKQDDKKIFEPSSVDKVIATNLTSLLGQFLLVLARVHRTLMEDFKTEHALDGMVDDDLPF